jgi:hypothetical protein
VLWILEDLHAADLLTLDLLAFLAQPVRVLHALIVVTARPADPRLTDRMLQRLGRAARDGVDLRLAPLGPDEVARLAERCAGRSLGAAARAELSSVTGGNPLFVVECARALRSTAGRTSERVPLPPTVRQAVLDRFAALGTETRVTLGAGAVLGREFAAGTVARMRQMLPAQIIEALLPALRSGFVTEPRPGLFAFSHALVRDAVYDAMSPDERCRGHVRAEAALAVAGEAADVLVERAHHALSGIAPDNAARALALGEEATRHLESAGAFDRAYAMKERIVEARRAGLAPGTPSPQERLELARLARAAGRHADSRRLCEQLFGEARAARDGELLGRTALSFGAEIRPAVVDGRLVAMLEESIAAIGEGDPVLRCLLVARLAAAQQPAPDPMGPIGMAREAIARARAQGDERLLCDVLHTAGAALVDFAPIEEQMQAARELLARAQALGDRPKMLRARARLANSCAEVGDFAAFEAEVDRMLELSVELGHPKHRWQPLLFASMRALARGDLAESDRCLVEVGQLAGLIDDPALALAEPAHRFNRACLMHRDDELREFLRLDLGGTVFADVPHMAVGNVALRAGALARLEDASAVRDELTRIAGRVGLIEGDNTFFSFLTEAYALCGTEAERRHGLVLLAAIADRQLVSGHVTMTYEGPIARLIALVEAALGDGASAERRLRDCLARAAERGHRPWEAQLRYDLARVLGSAGRPTEAVALAAEAAALATALGMPGLARRAAARAAGEAAPGGAGGAAAEVAAGAPARALGSSATAPPPERLVLVPEGDVWQVRHGDRCLRVRDTRGMRLLARLVERPGEELHVLALVSDDAGAALTESNAGDELDGEARQAYRRRLGEIDEEIAEAEGRADRGRLDRLRGEREMLVEELARAFGMGGRPRRAGSATERARVNVQRRIKDAVARVREVDDTLGRYLEKAVRTGTYCCFRP